LGSTHSCGIHGDSCCTSIEVPGGTYSRTYTYDDTGVGPSGAADPAIVSGFRLDKYEVTVWRYRQFFSAVTNDG
jgi:formylglycine-generating enzyme required for sulfatase activity